MDTVRGKSVGAGLALVSAEWKAASTLAVQVTGKWIWGGGGEELGGGREDWAHVGGRISGDSNNLIAGSEGQTSSSPKETLVAAGHGLALLPGDLLPSHSHLLGFSPVWVGGEDTFLPHGEKQLRGLILSKKIAREGKDKQSLLHCHSCTCAAS